MSDDWDWDNSDSEDYSSLEEHLEFYNFYDFQDRQDFKAQNYKRRKHGYPPSGTLWQVKKSTMEERKRNGLMVFDFFGSFAFKGKEFKIGALITPREKLSVNPTLPILRIHSPSKRNPREIEGEMWKWKRQARKKTKNPPTLYGNLTINGKPFKLNAWKTPLDQLKEDRKLPILKLSLR